MILITGATGFVGRYIVEELLSEGKELRLLVRNPQERSLPWTGLADIVEGDVLDPLSLERALEGVQYVVHAAAVVSYDSRKRKEMKAVNVTGTANLVNACLEKGIEKLVHISSIAATGKAGKGETVNEASKWQPGAPHNYYGLTKRMAELEVHRGVAEGLPSVILNPGLVLGPGDWSGGTPKIFSVLSKGMAFYNRGVTGYVAAADVARAARLALESDLTQGERYILVAENLPQSEFFSQVLTALGQQPPRWKLPAFLALAFGHLAQAWAHLRGQEAFLSPESLRSSVLQTRYDGSKAQRELGLSYTPISEVIRETAKAFLMNGMG